MASVNRPTLAGLQAQIEALRHNLDLVETERDSLRHNLDLVEGERNALHTTVGVLSAQLDAAAAKAREYEIALTNVNVSDLMVRLQPSPTITAQISARRAAMQRAREEAMRTGRSAKVQW